MAILIDNTKPHHRGRKIYHKGVCPICNAEFEGCGQGQHLRICCSKPCADEYQKLRKIEKESARKQFRFKSCKQCGKEFEVKRYESGEYCSKKCRDIHCGCKTSICLECGATFLNDKHGSRKFCGTKCSSVAMSRRAAEKTLAKNKGVELKKAKRKRISEENRKAKREELAKMLRLFRNVKSCKAISDILGEAESHCSTVLRRSKHYLKKMQKRSSNSLWRKDGEKGNNLSKLFKFESDFNKELVLVLNKAGAIADGETSVPGGTRRKVDVFVSTLLGKFCIESKISRRTNCVDECLGQVMVKSIYLDAKPVMAFPSDLELDPVIINAARQLGIRIVNEKTIVQELII